MKILIQALFTCSMAVWLFFSGSPPVATFAPIPTAQEQAQDTPPTVEDDNNKCLSSIIYLADPKVFRFKHNGEGIFSQLFDVEKGKAGVVSFMKVYGTGRFENEYEAAQYYRSNRHVMGNHVTLTQSNTSLLPSLRIKGICEDVGYELLLNKKEK